MRSDRDFVRILTNEHNQKEANQMADLLRERLGCGVFVCEACYEPGEVSSAMNDLALVGLPIIDEEIVPILPGRDWRTAYIRGIIQTKENLELIRARFQRLGYI